MLECLIKQFKFEILDISFTSDEEEKTWPQVHVTLPVQPTLMVHSL